MVKVSVTNQTSTNSPNCTFNKVDGVNASNFLAIYGDHFISGFIEGGEFTAIVSVNCLDKSATNEIQADLKGSFNAISASGNFHKLGSDMAKHIETTVSVSWVGGGGLKNAGMFPRSRDVSALNTAFHPDLRWDIQTMVDVAASFPQRVAACPDTTFAILTKYTNIKSYYSSLPENFNPVTYENAELYTSGLLDDYMCYKVYLKTVREMRLAPGEWEQNTYDADDEPFDTTPADLDYARREILLNMLLIVDRVNKIEKRPELATMFILGRSEAPPVKDYRLDEKDLAGPEDPSIFAMRLPVKAASRVTAPLAKLIPGQPVAALTEFGALFQPSKVTSLNATTYEGIVSHFDGASYARKANANIKRNQQLTPEEPSQSHHIVLHTTRKWDFHLLA